MTEDQRIQPAAADQSPAAATPGSFGPRASSPVPSGSGGALTGEVQESVDPFDYAETIVRDLALHVGSRLRDFRSDLAAMHSAVVQLPETMKVNALGQSVQDLRERVATLTGTVNGHLNRPSEEVARLGTGLNDLAQRLAGLESWIAAARQSGGVGNLPALPVPTGGFVEMEQFDRVIDQTYESVMRVVGAVRDLQLDIRDLRTEMRGGEVRGAATAAAPAPVPNDYDPRGDLARLSGRLEAMEDRLAGLSAAPAAATALVPAAATAGADSAQLAALVFGAWNRLGQPCGAESLRTAVDQAARLLAGQLGDVVRAPQLARGPGLVAVATGRVRGADVVALLAVEDLCGRSWQLQSGGTEVSAADPATTRAAAWRTLLSACALTAQAKPGARIVPVLVYGNGSLDSAPTPADIAAFADAVGAGDAARNLVQVAADGLSLPGLLTQAAVAPAISDALG